MKIAWLANSIPGTGGGRYYVSLANRFIETYEHDVTFYLQDMGNVFGDQLKASVKHIAQYELSDAAICGDPGRGHVVGYVFDGIQAGKKIWCMNFFNAEFLPWVTNPHYIKVAQTTWFAKQVKMVDPANNVRLCLGGTDTKFWRFNPVHPYGGLLVYPKKSGWSAIEAIRIACKVHPGLYMMRFGGEEAQWYDKDFSDIKCVNVGHPAHEVEAIREAYHSAMIYVSAESNYGWGFSQCIAEAMACGCAVVGGDFDGFSDMMIDGVTALTVLNDGATELAHNATCMTRPSPEALAEKILLLAEDANLRSELVHNARLNIERFDYDIMAEKFNEVLCE